MVTPDRSQRGQQAPRTIVIGKNSIIWRHLERNVEQSGLDVVAISHAEISHFDFAADDTIVLLSYAPKAQDNIALVNRVLECPHSELVLISSSSCVSTLATQIYQYPATKRAAELAALNYPSARVVRIGMFYRLQSELPAGGVLATSASDLTDLLRNPEKALDSQTPSPDQRVAHYFRYVILPPSSMPEKFALVAYSAIARKIGRGIKLLRPLDFVLSRLGWRWYGYVFLSGQAWNTTTS